MPKYLFRKIETVEDLLKELGRIDIPSTQIVIRRPAIDKKTGEYLGEIEIEFPDNVRLSTADEAKLKALFPEYLMRKM